MKQLTSTLFSERIQVDESVFISICIEDKRLLYSVLDYLSSDFRGKDSYFSIVDSKTTKEEEPLFVESIFHLDPNSKKNLNALYRLLKNLHSDSIDEQIDILKNQIKKIVGDIAVDFDMDLVYAESIKSDDLFKMMDLRFIESEEAVEKRLIQYICLCHELQGSRVFFAYGLHQFLTDEQLETIFKELAYKRVSLINIEPQKTPCLAGLERQITIDKDLCAL